MRTTACAGTPRQARHALAYVLNNWRKHREDRALFARKWNVDPFSSGVYFGGWRERRGAEVMWQWPAGYQPLVVYFPTTWLLRVGWIEHGGGGSYRSTTCRARQCRQRLR